MRLALPRLAATGTAAPDAKAFQPTAGPSLVRRLVFLAAAWSIAVLILAGLALSTLFNQAELANFDNELARSVDSLLAGASVDGGVIAGPPAIDPRSQRAYSGTYWEITTLEAADRRQIVKSRSLWDHSLPLPDDILARLAKAPGEMISYDAVGPLNKPLRITAMQGGLTDVAAPVVFMAAEDRTPLDESMRKFDTTIAIALGLLGAGLLIAVIVQVRVGLQPLFSLRREVAGIRMGRSDRILGRYPSELEPLANELNALMAHTQEIVERQRTHVGNLAHALKTPISVMLTEARQQPGALAEVVTRQAQTMEQHVSHHLRRARAAASAQGHGERTEVSPVLEDLSRTLEKIFRGKVTAVDWDCPDDLMFQGERQDLMEICGNVMENACKWCAGRVRTLAEPSGPRQMRLTVEDDGPGLPPSQYDEVLRRGARLDEQTPGSGLGLSIVDELVRAYGGALTLEASAMGGLKVIILLPRADA